MTSPEIGAFSNQIAQFANDQLGYRRHEIINLSLQQGGVCLSRDGHPLPDDPFDFLEKTQATKELISPNQALLHLETDSQLADVFGLASLIPELRTAILSQPSPSHYGESFLHQTLGDDPKILKGLASACAKIQLATEFAAQTRNQPLFLLLAAWLDVFDKIGASISKDKDSFQQITAQEKSLLFQPKVPCQGKPPETYPQKLRRLLSLGLPSKSAKETLGDLKDEDNFEGRGMFIQRVNSTLGYFQNLRQQERITPQEYQQILKEIGINEKIDPEELLNSLISRELISIFQKAYRLEAQYRYCQWFNPGNAALFADQLADEFLITTFSLGESLLLEQIHTPTVKDKGERIDLFQIKERIRRANLRAQEVKTQPDLTDREKQIKLRRLDRKIALAIAPVVNKIATLFPSDEAYFLAACLVKNQATCVGKVNILSAAFRFLGLKPKPTDVLLTLGGGSSHSLLEIDLFTRRLVIDANYPRIPERKTRKFRANKTKILPGYEVYAYLVAENKDRLCKVEFIRLDPATGKAETCHASIPYPHQVIISSNKTGILPSSVYFNYAHFWKSVGDKNSAEYYFRKASAINPNDPDAYFHLGFLYYEKKDLENTIFHLKKYLQLIASSRRKNRATKENIEKARNKIKEAKKSLQVSNQK